jgi:2-oxoisovalerate dehydrogenase E1 component alpha subunit
MLQFLDSSANIVDELPDFACDPKILLDLYRLMNKARIFDKKAVDLQRTGFIGTYPGIYGQEAISVAIGHTLLQNDVFIPYYRDFPAQMQRGVLLSEVLAYWGGDERGNNFLHNSHDLPNCVPIASQCLHAAGVAFALQYKGSSNIALVSLGDGATSQGDFYEALNFASLYKLPLVFVINNNQWAISVNIAKQTLLQNLTAKAEAFGIPALRVDGNDVIAVKQALLDACFHARSSKGPMLIEAVTYRLCDHTTADDAKRYQEEQEYKLAESREPLIRLRKFLMEHHNFDADLDESMTQSLQAEVQVEIDKYLSSYAQDFSDMFKYNFANMPNYLALQQVID